MKSSNVPRNGNRINSPNQRRAMTALMEHGTINKAAEVAKLNPKTLQRYLKDDNFRTEIAAREAARLDEASRLLIRGQLTALTALLDLIENSKSESVRRLAAKDWMDINLRMRENKNEARISALERSVYYGQE